MIRVKGGDEEGEDAGLLVLLVLACRERSVGSGPLVLYLPPEKSTSRYRSSYGIRLLRAEEERTDVQIHDERVPFADACSGPGEGGDGISEASDGASGDLSDCSQFILTSDGGSFERVCVKEPEERLDRHLGAEVSAGVLARSRPRLSLRAVRTRVHCKRVKGKRRKWSAQIKKVRRRRTAGHSLIAGTLSSLHVVSASTPLASL